MAFMRKYLVLFVLLWSGLTAGAQGWRPGEAEVLVSVSSISDISVIKHITSNFEKISADSTTFRLYLLPGELETLRQSGLRFRITTPDLKHHYEKFWDNPLVPPGYYTYEQIIAIIDSLATNFPSICKKIVIGTSVAGRQLAVLKISDNPDLNEAEAGIMFDGGIHGDEIGGAQNMIMYARELCLNYGSDPTCTGLIDNREIWIFPMVNPDGRVNMSRYNNSGVDLNRDCGYMWNAEGQSPGAFSQKESKAWRDFIFDNQMAVYTNYHSGTEIIAFPWSYRSSQPRDYTLLNNLAGIYSSSSGYANLAYGQGYNIMYPINGSTKDVIYGSLGNVGWSIEISDDKQPASSLIPTYYNYNKSAMTEMILRSDYGISGIISDSLNGAPVAALIWVDNFFPVYSDPFVGDFHKYLVPGSYSVKVTANGYKTRIVSNLTVPVNGKIDLQVKLEPEQKWFGYKVMSCQIPGNNFSDPGYTPGALGAPDGIPYSLGRLGWIILDMHDTIFNGPGNDFRVVQSGTTPKLFTVSAGNNPDGPFTVIGTGTGTTAFDLSGSSLDKARFLRIKDEATGPVYGEGAGFNLDAVEILTPQLSVNFMANSDSICKGHSVQFTDLSTGSPTSWLWTFPGGNPSSSSASTPPEVMYADPGNYDVSLTVSNNYSTQSLTKPAMISVHVCDDIDDKFMTDEPVVFPNPAVGSFTIDTGNDRAFEWVLFNSSGQRIAGSRVQAKTGPVRITPESAGPGLYFIKIGQDSGSVIRKVVVID